MNKYYVILWRSDFNSWTRTHTKSFTLPEAQEYSKDEQFLNKNVDVIHEMWLDCLEEWPEPGFFN